jgi:hypothetical protein
VAGLGQKPEFSGFHAKSSIRRVKAAIKNEVLFNDRGSKTNSSAGSANTQSMIAKADDMALTTNPR